MDIDKLEDRELDVAVAEARGWIKGIRYWEDPSKPDALWGGTGYTTEEWYDYDLPHYRPSADIAAAWELVEEMAAMDAMEVYVSNQLEWDCYCTRPVGTEAYARGPTAPIAICRCYLKLKAKASD